MEVFVICPFCSKPWDKQHKVSEWKEHTIVVCPNISPIEIQFYKAKS